MLNLINFKFNFIFQMKMKLILHVNLSKHLFILNYNY